MQTTRTVDERTNSEERPRRMEILAILIAVGAVAALVVVALLILVGDPGGRVTTAPGAQSAVVDGPAPRAAGPDDQDRSWLCNVISDDSAPESRAAATDMLAREGIACGPGEVLDTQATPDK